MGDTVSTAPDWNLVDFAVDCARCGFNLRGRQEPTCPRCALEFDWDDAVPLEHLRCQQCGYHLYGLKEKRCPECGSAFTWDVVLAAYRRSRKPLFEYRWRDEPLRSLARTWRMAMRPKKFWQKLDIHDPPNTGALVLTVFSALLLWYLVYSVLTGLLSFMVWCNRYYIMVASGGRRWAYPTGIARAWNDVLHVLMSAETLALAASISYWLVGTLIGLLVFQESMSRCHVRTAHVVRVWAYGVSLVVPVMVGAFVLLALASECSLRLGFNRWFPSYAYLMQPAAMLCIVAFAIWSVRCAYRHYLRMQHSLAVAIASQAIAVLFVGVVEMTAFLGLRYSLLAQLLDSLGRW